MKHLGDYGWLTIRKLRQLMRHWRAQGLTDESLVLVYSDKNEQADGMVGICCVQVGGAGGADPDGEVALLLAPGMVSDKPIRGVRRRRVTPRSSDA